MEREEYLQLITSIGTCENDAERRTMLSQLTDEATNLFTMNSQLTEQNSTLSAQIDEVQKANMKLFLQLQDQKTPEEKKKDQTGLEDDKPKEKLNFKDLFDEKGMIK